MKRRHLLTLATSVLLLPALVTLAQRQHDPADDAAQARQSVRDRIAAVRQGHERLVAFNHSGRWQPHRGSRDAQPWFIQAQQDATDGTISGRLTVIGSGEFDHGTISSTTDGTSIRGVVTDDDGGQLATFTGTVTGNAMQGTYHTARGDHGDWEELIH